MSISGADTVKSVRTRLGTGRNIKSPVPRSGHLGELGKRAYRAHTLYCLKSTTPITLFFMSAQQEGHGGQSGVQESPEVPWVTLEEIGVQSQMR